MAQKSSFSASIYSDPIAPTLTELACRVLTTADPAQKIALTFEAAKAWRGGGLEIGAVKPPARPARPARPELKRAGEMPKRDDVTYFIAHPCHTSMFNDETETAARADYFGGTAAKQNIICCLMQARTTKPVYPLFQRNQYHFT